MSTTADRIQQYEEALSQTTEAPQRKALLLEYSTFLARIDAVRSLSLAEEGKRLCNDMGDREGVAQFLLGISAAYDCLSNYSEALAHAQRALAISSTIGSTLGRANAHNSSGIVHKNRSAFSDALREFNSAVELFIDLGDDVRLAAAYNNIGTVHDTAGNLEPALESYLKALRIYERLDHEASSAVVMGNIGNIYFYLKDYATSLQYCERTLQIHERLRNNYGIAHILGNISSLHKHRGEFDRALETLETSLDIFQHMGERRYEAVTLVKIAMLQKELGRASSALKMLQRATRMLAEIDAKGDYCDALHRLGVLYLQKGDSAKAFESLLEGLAIAEEVAAERTQANIHLDLVAAHKRGGDYRSALHHFERYQNLIDNLDSIDRHRAITRIQVQFDIERAEREREFFRERAAYMESIADQRSKELSTNAAQLVRTNNLLQSIRLELKKSLDATEVVRKKSLTSILERIESDLRSGDDWKRFEEMYQLVHHDFIHILSERFPDLSATELRICTLLNINLSNKEIADMLCISTRTVESHRYRIRRKIGLDADTSLSAYMMGLGKPA